MLELNFRLKVIPIISDEKNSEIIIIQKNFMNQKEGQNGQFPKHQRNYIISRRCYSYSKREIPT